MFNHSFTRKVSTQTKLMAVFLILPLYVFCGPLIGNALLKFAIVTFSVNMDYATANTYLNFIVDLGMLLVVGWILKDTMIEQWHDFKKNIKDNLIYGCLIGMAILYGLALIGGFITMMLGGHSSSENQVLLETITNAHPLIMIITTVIFAPILEEMIFRGIVFGWFYELNPKLAYLVSGFIFGFIHVMISILSGNISEWVQIFGYFFMGVGLCYLYEKRDNIYVPILAHATNNLIAMITMIF